MNLIEEIVAKIVELSLEKDSNDSVRNIYSVLMDIRSETGKVMKAVRDQERLV